MNCNWEGGYKQQFTVFILRNLTISITQRNWCEQGLHSLEKSLDFSSTLNVVAWKVFFNASWLPKTENKS